uniref:Basic helix-loop-helix ARNT like 2 n=1 Tax=Fundulus heteroclitus TaxID=8078 RepID=A0A3Q2QF02_FUNHE
MGAEGEGEADKQDSSYFSCLVAVGRIHSHSAAQVNGEVRVRPTEFVTRYAMDGKFTFVDQRATTILGYLPQELLGTSCYEYFHQDDLLHLADRHRKVLRSREKIETNCYKFKTKYGSFVTLQSQWFSFVNPWNKEVEYIVSTNTTVLLAWPENALTIKNAHLKFSHLTCFVTDCKKSLPVLPGISSASGTMIYAGSIGTQIANELLDFNKYGCITRVLNKRRRKKLDAERRLQKPINVKMGPTERLCCCWENSQLDLDSVVGASLNSLSNDEAAMAVIMSLLETDTNLGEAVDFEEMHWSL